MVGNEDLRNLETLAGQYGIYQKLQSDVWPSALQSTFQCIQDLSQKDFQTYSSSISGSLSNQPWRRQNKARVEWLVEQAGRLSQNTANENSWRMRIENAVLERFSVEVACPVCKYRLWRSEIESTYTGSSRLWAELDQRRLNREPCKCPITDRPQNWYEIGTSRLFEDRVDEPVVHDDPDSELPTQRPDRIVGLRETNNMRLLLDQPPQIQSNKDARNIRDLVRCSPFKRQSNPLLFPFLVLEAKSDSAPTSFSAIQTQTAFPIRLLLNLQRDLQSFKPSDQERPEPLVWFLAYRGSDWKVYGCSIGLSSEAHPTYNIHYLRGGDITTKDGALHLLLLIDYIIDWARDTFRPSILAQLSSLATGRNFDEISLGPDSDILSKSRTIQDWITRVPTTVVQDDSAGPSGSKPIHPENHDDILSVKLPYTKLGSVRPVSTIDFQLTGLRLTEGNVESLLALSDGPQDRDPRGRGQSCSRCARKLVNELTRWDEVLVILGADLDYIERVWTNEEKTMYEPFDEGPGAEFYAIFEYRCFMNVSWAPIRELSYFAISKSAFNILVEHAAYQRRHDGIESLSKALRPCSSASIKETIDCLRSGSAWQVLHSAVSSTLLTIYPEPQRIRDDYIPPVEYLDFGYIHVLRVRCFIKDYLKLAEIPTSKAKNRIASKARNRKRAKAGTHAWEEKTCNRSFCRRARRSVRASEAFHDQHACTRCRNSKQDPFALKYWDQANVPSPTAYGAILVVSLKEEPGSSYQHQTLHDLSLFVLEKSPWLESTGSISIVVEDLAQSKSIYHTIRHEPDIKVGGPKDVLWNLPCPYRKTTARQRWDIACWVRELNKQSIPEENFFRKSMPLWVHQQILLHFLRDNMPYDDALAALIEFRDGKKRQYNYTWSPSNGDARYREVPVDCNSLYDFYDKVFPIVPLSRDDQAHSMLPFKLKLRGE